jgi:hypothetical protein
MVGDAGKHIGKPGARVDVVESGGDDERIHGCRSLSTAIGTREQPGFPAKRDAAQRTFRGIVRQADATIVEEAGE